MNSETPINLSRRAVIDRRVLADQIAEQTSERRAKARQEVVELLSKALEEGRKEISVRLVRDPSQGRERAADQSFLVDQIVRLAYDFVTTFQYPAANRSSGERLALLAVGGYGREEMAPHSDVDIAFVTPYKRTAWTEQVVEAMLYILWDLGLKVGQSSRSIDEMVHMSKDDLTIRTAMLESRFIWGDREVYEEAKARFWSDVVAGTEADFIAQKMKERDERHHKMGDSRYVVEPNVKDGKGGLRDLQTLYWIGKYIHRVRTPAEFVEVGLLTEDEYRMFERAEEFFLAVRCHMHDITGRAEDRLTFDLQREVADRMNYSDRPGKSPVERFMKFYFFNAKNVGDLTGLFLAHLEEKMGRKSRGFMPRLRRRPKKLHGFVVNRGRIDVPNDQFFDDDPVRILQLFSLADKNGLEVHPNAMRIARRDAKLVDGVRRDERACEFFLDVLTSPRDPETVLRWMNEAAVFGRFVPDFGRVVAQMQFDMYHHYTVDEHTIRAIGLLSRIERGDLSDDHPLSTQLMPKLNMRRALYVATLLHDIAKGRGGDHSVIGADIATRVCPRLGLGPAETDTVRWLVRNHLLMSATAFKRDLSDYKTIKDFADTVQSLERLRLLVVLTVVDIRAVGPGVWNSWKGQLLTDLYEAAEEFLRPGFKDRGRAQKIEEKKSLVLKALGWPEEQFAVFARSFDDAYWIAEPEDVIARNARHYSSSKDEALAIDACYYEDRGATLVTVYAGDHPGLFYRIAGAIHLAGGNIIDARIHTSRDGMALDNFLVQDPVGRPFSDGAQIERLKSAIAESLVDRSKMLNRLKKRPLPRRRMEAFDVNSQVIIDNNASNRFNVIEVISADRPALLKDLAKALFDAKVMLHSAHVTTYGERAVDTFYVTDLFGEKIDSKQRFKTLEKRLLAAAEEETQELPLTA